MRSKDVYLLKCLIIFVFSLHPLITFSSNISESSRLIEKRKLDSKEVITNTFPNEINQNKLIVNIQNTVDEFLKDSHKYLSTTYKQVDPYVKSYYVHIILSIIILSIIIIIIKKNISYNKRKNAHNNHSNKGEINTNKEIDYDNDNENKSEQEKITLIGRKSKKARLDVDYSNVFKNNSNANKEKSKITSIPEPVKMTNDLFKYTNMISEKEKINSHYFSNDYISKLEFNSNNNEKKYLGVKVDYDFSKSNNYYDNTEYSDAYNSYNNYNNNNNSISKNDYNYHASKSNVKYLTYDFNNDSNNNNINFNNEIDYLDVLERNNTKKADDAKLGYYDNSYNSNIIDNSHDIDNTNNTNNSNNSASTNKIITDNLIEKLNFQLNNKKERTCHDDLMDFFSNVEQISNENIDSNIVDSAIKQQTRTLEKDNKDVKEDLKNKERSYSTNSNNSNTSKDRVLKKEYNPTMELIPEEEEDNIRKRSEFSALNNSQYLQDSSSILNTSNCNDETDEERVIRKLKKLNFKRCMIK